MIRFIFIIIIRLAINSSRFGESLVSTRHTTDNWNLSRVNCVAFVFTTICIALQRASVRGYVFVFLPIIFGSRAGVSEKQC